MPLLEIKTGVSRENLNIAFPIVMLYDLQVASDVQIAF